MCTLPKGDEAIDADGKKLLNYVEIDPEAVPAEFVDLPSCLPVEPDPAG